MYVYNNVNVCNNACLIIACLCIIIDTFHPIPFVCYILSQYILSDTFCPIHFIPIHFVRYILSQIHFVSIHFVQIHFVRYVLSDTFCLDTFCPRANEFTVAVFALISCLRVRKADFYNASQVSDSAITFHCAAIETGLILHKNVKQSAYDQQCNGDGQSLAELHTNSCTQLRGVVQFKS